MRLGVRWSGCLGGLLVVLASCVPPARSPEAISEDYVAQEEVVVQDYQERLIWPVCGVPPRPRAICGMIGDSVLRPAFIKKFVRKYCDGEDGPSAWRNSGAGSSSSPGVATRRPLCSTSKNTAAAWANDASASCTWSSNTVSALGAPS